jgi:hypothetical protein
MLEVFLKGNTLSIILNYLEGDKQALLALVNKQLWELIPLCTQSFTINSYIIGQILIDLHQRKHFLNYLLKLKLQLLQLNLYTHRITGVFAVYLLNMPNITILNLAQNNLYNLDEHIIQRLAHAISKLLDLKELNLGHNDMDKNAPIFIKAISQLHNLERLNLESNKLGNEGTIELASTLLNIKQLKYLNLDNNNAGSYAIEKILKNLTPSIISLHLERNNIGPNGAEALATSLLKMKRLKELYIGHNQISTGMKPLSKSIAQLLTLEKLNCPANDISLRDVDFNFLEKLTKLKSLNFMWNPLNLDLDRAKSLAHILKDMSQLECINLRFTEITPEGVKLIQDSLPNMIITFMCWTKI